MAERVTVRQDRKLLAVLGTCTTVVAHTYARNHGIDLKEVEVRLEYRRNFDEDCEHCEEIDRYEEEILEELEFQGDLSDEDREKLRRAAGLCSIRQMMEQGVPAR